VIECTSAECFGFEEYNLDLTRGSLRDANGEIELRPRSFELLRYLIESAGRLISKDELINVLWPNVIVSDDSFTRCVSDLRHPLNDPDRHIIKTVPRRGYLFSSPVSVQPRYLALNEPFGRGSDESEQESSLLVLPEKLPIAVLPFQNMSGDPQSRNIFVDGMVVGEDREADRSEGHWFRQNSARR
jgi:DNA-binding winged helix-turn-helix (wHTH) protein